MYYSTIDYYCQVFFRNFLCAIKYFLKLNAGSGRLKPFEHSAQPKRQIFILLFNQN